MNVSRGFDPSKPDKPSRQRVLRAELVIAALALVTSACASVAAILQSRESAIETQAALEQTKIVSKQLGSSLWPYLSFDVSFSPASFGIGFTNQGLGPALIRSFNVSVDGRHLTHLRDIVKVADPHQRGARIDENDLGVGSVIRPSASITVFAVSDKHLSKPRAEETIQRARFEVCYCSLLDDCWLLRSEETEPQVVHGCPRQTMRISI